jgi:hypothetical protein
MDPQNEVQSGIVPPRDAQVVVEDSVNLGGFRMADREGITFGSTSGSSEIVRSKSNCQVFCAIAMCKI